MDGEKAEKDGMETGIDGVKRHLEMFAPLTMIDGTGDSHNRWAILGRLTAKEILRTVKQKQNSRPNKVCSRSSILDSTVHLYLRIQRVMKND
jgi:hypothetical protein